jgi:hypothetical protein
MSNPIFVKDFLPIDPDTAFVAFFGHLAGYDAGYYGYAWADAIAADMATVFEKAPDGFLDKTVGMKLRKEIYAPGGSRDIDVSIHNFLGRDRLHPALPENPGHRHTRQGRRRTFQRKQSRRGQTSYQALDRVRRNCRSLIHRRLRQPQSQLISSLRTVD